MDTQPATPPHTALPAALEGRLAVTVPEFASLGGWSEQHVANMIDRGELRAFSFGRTRRILVTELIRIVEGQE